VWRSQPSPWTSTGPPFMIIRGVRIRDKGLGGKD
jgi:hypothetical protein